MPATPPPPTAPRISPGPDESPTAPRLTAESDDAATERVPADERPIGVFDSGVGGLSVLQAIRQELPNEDLIYVADSAYAPYGDRPPSEIQARTAVIVEYLIGRRVKAVVVACNTATGVSVEGLRARFALPIVAIEPALKPAVAQTTTGVVGVLATTRTLSSEKFRRLFETHGQNVTVLLQACPGLVQQVERGELSGAETQAMVERYVRPLIQARADTLVLGCTHYPFLRTVLQEVAGPNVTLVDPAMPVAREVRRRLAAAGLLARHDRAGVAHFVTSGAPDEIARVMADLWGGPVSVDLLIEPPAVG